MLALVATGRAGELELREVDDPVPRPNEALVAVRATSLNRGEVRSLASAKPGARPGWDLAGVVLEPAVTGGGPPAGARVVGLARSRAWAERVAVDTEWLAHLPDAVTFEAAAALPVAGVTAWRALQIPERIDRQKVLVTGAAGGVGRFAIQLASHLGAYVTAVVGSEARGEGLRELGAEDVVVGMPESGPYDVVLESVGGESLARALELIAGRGCVVSYGVSNGSSTTFDVGPFFRKGGPRLQGLYVFEEIAHHRSGTLDLGYLAEQVGHGALQVEVGLTTSWRRPKAALDALMDRRVRGKAVLVID
jgi:NADPH:quinone reductase